MYNDAHFRLKWLISTSHYCILRLSKLGLDCIKIYFMYLLDNSVYQYVAFLRRVENGIEEYMFSTETKAVMQCSFFLYLG